MKTRRTPIVIGAGIFTVTFIAGWMITRRHTEAMGFAEVVGVFHGALGIGFASGFLSYVVLNALSSKRRT